MVGAAVYGQRIDWHGAVVGQAVVMGEEWVFVVDEWRRGHVLTWIKTIHVVVLEI